MRDLDDEAMLKIMAADNDDAYNLVPSFILETVLAAKSFLSNKPDSMTGHGKLCHSHETKEAHRIHTFLSWPRTRVEDALAQLAAIDRKELSQEAVRTVPTVKAASTLQREVKKARNAERPMSHEEQVQIARSAAKSTDLSPPAAPGC